MKKCSVKDCLNPVKARGLCDNHYKVKQRSGELETAKYQKRKGSCSIEGCEKRVYANNLCNMHYQRFKKHGDTSERCLKKKTRSMNLEERLKFYSTVVNENECYPWQGHIGDDGYGIVWWKNYPQRAHRVSFVLYHGQIKKGNVVCHKCNNKLCVNPDHLYQATPKQNTQDAIRDGLVPKQKTGEEAQASKLTEAQAIEIIKRRKEGEAEESIANDYGISHWTVGDIYRGKSWKNIDRTSIVSEKEVRRDSLGRISNVKTKLTEDQVKEIKRLILFGSHSQNALAEQFSVDKNVIANIRKEKQWTHIPWPKKKRKRKRLT